MMWSIWNNSFLNCFSYTSRHFTSHGRYDLAPNVWLHSSVGRATHWQRGGHGFESRWSPDFFQASSFQLLKLENLLRWSFFTLWSLNVSFHNKRQSWILDYLPWIPDSFQWDLYSGFQSLVDSGFLELCSGLKIPGFRIVQQIFAGFGFHKQLDSGWHKPGTGSDETRMVSISLMFVWWVCVNWNWETCKWCRTYHTHPL